MAKSLFKNPIVHQLWMARQKAKQDLKLTADTTASQCWISKRPQDSFVQVAYNFSSDGLLREAYKNPWGRIRFGKLLEDLDALAGNIAFFHVNTAGATAYPVIVTAAVDRIVVKQRPTADIDQTLSGQVTWTGKSSMEICMQCTDEINGTWLEAYVTFVTLDPETKKPMRIPSIKAISDDEKAAFEAGAARALLKKKRRREHKEMLQTADEQAAKLLQEASPLLTMPTLADPHAVLLRDTAMQNAMIAQPQVQNLHNRIFGGFLMRRAFELAFSNAYMFGGYHPTFQEVDEVSFSAPVDIGDLVVFKSRILYYEDGQIHVEVEAWVTEPENATAKRSNQFYFTFSIEQTPKRTRVLPANMDEARQIIVRMLREKEQTLNDSA